MQSKRRDDLDWRRDAKPSAGTLEIAPKRWI